MAVAVRSSGLTTKASNGNVSSFTMATPSGTKVGDFLLLIGASDTDSAQGFFVGPSGTWQTITGWPDGSTNGYGTNIKAWYRWATPADIGASWTISVSTGSGQVMYLLALTGVEPGSAIAASMTAAGNAVGVSTGTVATAPPITPDQNLTQAFILWSSKGGSGTTFAPTVIGNLTELADTASPYTAASLGTATLADGANGASPSWPATMSGGRKWTAAGFSLRPSAVAWGTRFLAGYFDDMDTGASYNFQSTTPVSATGVSGFTYGTAAQITLPANGAQNPGTGATANTDGGQRCELEPRLAGVSGIGSDGMIGPGEGGYFGISVLLDANYPTTATSWQNIQQWKNDGGGSPPIEMGINKGRLYLDGNNGAWLIPVCQVLPGQRYNIVTQLAFTESASTSNINVWVNGTQFVTNGKPVGAGLLYAGVLSYWKVGSYRDAAITQSSTISYGAAVYDPSSFANVSAFLTATTTGTLPTPSPPVADLRVGTGWASGVGVSARGAGRKVGRAPVVASLGLSARSSGAKTGKGSGSAAHGLAASGGGSKRSQGAGDARTGLSGRAAGVKVGIGTGWSPAIGVTSRGSGPKVGIGIGQAAGIGLSAFAIQPPPIPIFTGRPLTEDPLPLASSRYLVQNILTGEWLHTDLPLAEDQVTLTLSGPCEIAGKIRPEYVDLKAPDGSPLLRSWGHVVYLEMDGEIRAAGLITEDSYDDQTQTLSCQGVSAYPSVIAFQGSYRRYFANPLDVVADMWGYVQSFQNGNLGVTVERLGDRPAVLYGAKVNPVPGDTLLGLAYAPRPEGTDDDPPVLPVGRGNTVPEVWAALRAKGYAPQPFTAEDGSTVNPDFYGDAGQRIFVRKADLERAYSDFYLTSPTQSFPDPPDRTSSVTIDPFKVDWWDVRGTADVVNAAVKACPADYVERYRWNTPRTFVYQSVALAYPRLGRRRDDLRFVQGENIISPAGLASDPDGYATAVIGIGAGEGSESLRETAEVITPGRVRKTYVYRNSSITDRVTLARIVADELRQRSNGGYEVQSVVVQASHVNAHFGEYNVGDDVLVQVQVPHFGWVQQWGRITSMTLARGEDLVELKLRRSDSFFYGREVEQS